MVDPIIDEAQLLGIKNKIEKKMHIDEIFDVIAFNVSFYFVLSDGKRVEIPPL
jgi:hypothetical protein